MRDPSKSRAIASGSVVTDLRANLPAERSSLPRLRSLLVRFLDECDVGDHVFYDALLVTHELLANAIEHGSEEEDEVEIRVQLLRTRLCVVVCDRARKGRVPVALSPDEQRDGGRGLQVVGQLADWSEQIVGGRREVRAELALQ